MDCKQTRDLIQDYLDQGLKLGKRMLIERHIAGCSECAHEFRAYQAITRAMRKLELEPVPVGFADGVIGTMREAGRIVAMPAPVRRGIPGLGPARWRHAFIAAIIIGGVFVSLPGLFGAFKSQVGRAAVSVTDAAIRVQQMIQDADVVYGFVDAVARDMRAAKTILNAVASLVYSTGTSLLLPLGGAILMITGAVILLVRRKRSSQHALFVV